MLNSFRIFKKGRYGRQNQFSPIMFLKIAIFEMCVTITLEMESP